MNSHLPRVALLIETSREYARGLLRGVSNYLREHGPWSIYLEPHGLDDPPPKWLPEWKGDAILVRINDHQMADAIRETGIPAIDLRGALSDIGIPFIGVDNRPVATLGYEHLKNCGVRNFAFCGTPRGDNPNQDLRCDYFVETVNQAGYDCSVYCCEAPGNGRLTWEEQQKGIVAWLQTLPKPVGIMTCHDDRGLQVLDACRRAELSVPDQVAVLGVDNDPSLCNLCTPPLSSIDVNPARIGYEAASLAASLMNGGEAPRSRVLLGPPRGIAARRSTDTLWVEDRDVADAIRFIRENACEGISVRDVLSTVSSAPSALERKVKRVLGRTIKAEISRVRLARAKLLLAETDMPIGKIAVKCGFSEPKYFSEVFRQAFEMRATEYRQKFRDEV